MGICDRLSLPSTDDQKATPKWEIKPAVVARKERKLSKEEQGTAFRDAVWLRDKSRNRATGQKLTRVHPKQKGASLLPWDQIGEVDHAYPRSTHPDRIYDVENGLLLSKELNRLRKVPCARAPEHRRFDYSGPENRGLPQVFVWRDDDGNVTKERIG
jgi:hypothetical protein